MRNSQIATGTIILCVVGIAIYSRFRSHPQLPASPPSPVANEVSGESNPAKLSPSRAARLNNAQPPLTLPDGSPDPRSNVKIDPRLVEMERQYIEEMKADPSYQFKRPISFYGKVLDQDEKPVVEANVVLKWNRINSTNNTMESGEKDTETDAGGLFSLEGATGDGVCVVLSKPDYYTLRNNPTCFNYAMPLAANFHIPDPQKPVVFHLRKRGTAEPLLTGEKLFGFKPDGTQYYVNLLTGEKSTDPSSDWDLSVRLTRGEPNAERKFDWSVTFDASGGGLLETSDEFAFLAPESGYHPIENIQRANDAQWEGGGKYQFFVRSRDGKVYSRIEASITPDYNENGAINLKYFVNPSGSRNLEFDPNNVVQPGQ